MTRKDKHNKKIEGSDISEIFLVQIPQCVTALRRARRITTTQFDRKIILEKNKNLISKYLPYFYRVQCSFLLSYY
jgi:hypothetical protein